ncbi:unnamed protein product [Pleuronectes platessa]|uniref:Uncharacterized protein n=1 Tax=Pleuronectes platessa TaxID=8262 RepID=A0A9N7ZBY2_PLEPL|nr:unnamed protein product [Pleuronectes platessa]
MDSMFVRPQDTEDTPWLNAFPAPSRNPNPAPNPNPNPAPSPSPNPNPAPDLNPNPDTKSLSPNRPLKEHVGISRRGAEPVEQQEAEPVEQQEAMRMMYKLCCGQISVVVYISSTPESALITRRSGISSCFQVDVFVFYVSGSSSSS